MRIVGIIVRLLIAVALCVGVYTETGKWTAISMALLFVGTEFTAFQLKHKIVNAIKDAIRSEMHPSK